MPYASLPQKLRSGDRAPETASRVVGLLFVTGAAVVLLSLVLPHPEQAGSQGLIGVALAATIAGLASMIWASHARTWSVHVMLAAGTALVCLCVYLSGLAAGIYSMMFIWVVLVAASFFAGWAVAAHVAFILIAWGLALALVDEPFGFSSLTRWTLGSLVLVVTAAVMSEIVAGRKTTEERLQAAQAELEHLAHHDGLTGLANRRLFEREFARELSRAKRRETPLCLIAIDVDDFKGYNDQHGHPLGDRLLRDASAAWTDTLRTEDLIARVGGDEFIVLLPDCPRAEAEQAARRLCDVAPTACSTGVVEWERNESSGELLARLDIALYREKRIA